MVTRLYELDAILQMDNISQLLVPHHGLYKANFVLQLPKPSPDHMLVAPAGLLLHWFHPFQNFLSV
jgi:hypothetical protein